MRITVELPTLRAYKHFILIFLCDHPRLIKFLFCLNLSGFRIFNFSKDILKEIKKHACLKESNIMQLRLKMFIDKYK